MQTVLLNIQDSIAYITLNRPDKYNAFNREMALELQEHLKACCSNEVRAVYITGAGKAFSAGQDLAEVADPNGPDILCILKDHFNPIIRAIRRLEKPVVAAVNGVAAGAGANIALCCDIVVASSNASFIQAFSKIGLIPDSGGTFFLPRLVGWQRASALMMLGDKLSATEAERFGLAYKVIEAANFEAESKAMVSTLAKMPTRGLALTKKLLETSLINNMHDQLLDEEIYQEQAGKTFDFKEGVESFLQKRDPQFKGR